MSAVRFCYLLLIIISSFNIGWCTQGEPVVYFPPFELRAVPPVVNPNNFNSRLQQPLHHQVNHNHVEIEQQQIPNIVSTQSSTLPTRNEVQEHDEVKNETISVHNLLKALGINEDENKKTNEHERAATGRGYEYPSYTSYPQPPPDYGYPSRGYWPPSPPSYYQGDNSYAYLPPTYGHHSSPPPAKPFSLIPHSPQKSSETHAVEKPLMSKVASKVSGVIGLVMALLTGSTPDDLEIKGVKDLVINGIVKPLMLAKGGIKSLISKLSIPVIILLLVNLEMLVLIWWLWEDCQQTVQVQHHQPPVYPYRPAPNYGYNPY